MMATYRLFFPHQHIPDDISEPVEAESIEGAFRLFQDCWPQFKPSAVHHLGNLQRLENGRRVWVR